MPSPGARPKTGVPCRSPGLTGAVSADANTTACTVMAAATVERLLRIGFIRVIATSERLKGERKYVRASAFSDHNDLVIAGPQIEMPFRSSQRNGCLIGNKSRSSYNRSIDFNLVRSGKVCS